MFIGVDLLLIYSYVGLLLMFICVGVLLMFTCVCLLLLLCRRLKFACVGLLLLYNCVCLLLQNVFEKDERYMRALCSSNIDSEFKMGRGSGSMCYRKKAILLSIVFLFSISMYTSQ